MGQIRPHKNCPFSDYNLLLSCFYDVFKHLPLGLILLLGLRVSDAHSVAYFYIPSKKQASSPRVSRCWAAAPLYKQGPSPCSVYTLKLNFFFLLCCGYKPGLCVWQTSTLPISYILSPDFSFCNMVSLGSPGCPGIHYVEQ